MYVRTLSSDRGGQKKVAIACDHLHSNHSKIFKLPHPMSNDPPPGRRREKFWKRPKIGHFGNFWQKFVKIARHEEFLVKILPFLGRVPATHNNRNCCTTKMKKRPKWAHSTRVKKEMQKLMAFQTMPCPGSCVCKFAKKVGGFRQERKKMNGQHPVCLLRISQFFSTVAVGGGVATSQNPTQNSAKSPSNYSGPAFGRAKFNLP